MGTICSTSRMVPSFLLLLFFCFCFLFLFSWRRWLAWLTTRTETRTLRENVNDHELYCCVFIFVAVFFFVVVCCCGFAFVAVLLFLLLCFWFCCYDALFFVAVLLFLLCFCFCCCFCFPCCCCSYGNLVFYLYRVSAFRSIIMFRLHNFISQEPSVSWSSLLSFTTINKYITLSWSLSLSSSSVWLRLSSSLSLTASIHHFQHFLFSNFPLKVTSRRRVSFLPWGPPALASTVSTFSCFLLYSRPFQCIL